MAEPHGLTEPSLGGAGNTLDTLSTLDMFGRHLADEKDEAAGVDGQQRTHDAR